jgi:hypothetical protein
VGAFHVNYAASLPLGVLDEGTLSMNLLDFRLKSFGYERTAEVNGRPFLLFHRTETESESKLRPQLVKLWVVLPAEWVKFDETLDSLVIRPEGRSRGPRSTGIALEVDAEAERFTEQGLPFRRRPLGKDGVLYVPEELSEPLASPAALTSLGLA